MSTAREHTSHSLTHLEYRYGAWPFDELGNLITFIEVWSRREKRQMTPSFIDCAISDAFSALQRPGWPDAPDRGAEPVIHPRGATTDVGLHAGGQARATIWPLSQAILRVGLQRVRPDAHKPLFCVAMAHLQTWLLAARARELTVDSAVRQGLNAIGLMLERVTADAAVLAEQGHDVQAMEQCMRAAEARVEELQKRRGERDARVFDLPRSVHR